MDWNEIGRDNLSAARGAHATHVRTVISRAYYAAHSVLTQALIDEGYIPERNRQTPPHSAQARLIGLHLAGRGQRFVREMREKIRRLYAARLDADYNRRVTIDSTVSRQALRDAHSVFSMLEVTP
jgi:uncharacterized protein (UPF0332 family)